jgi:2-desacetyl-2-hydroxyethyl bacteriochlorophyllide A dehydrogenase
MLTIVCETPGVLRAVERPLPQPAEHEVLLRVKRVGVCGTDLHIFTGDQPFLAYPRVMGHELSGIVETAPAGAELAAGDEVFVMPYLSCGRCIACAQGKTNCCVRIEVLGVHRDGAFAEYLSVPQQFVRRAQGIDLDQAAMLEFLSIGAHAVRRGDVRSGQRVLVAGAGPIGMAAILFAQLRGASVTALDTRTERVEFCVEHLGARAAVVVGVDDEQRLSELTGGEFFDVVFDATGNPRAMERGFRFIAHGGKYVLVSVVRDRISFEDPEFHKREATLLASRNATMEDFDTVLAAMRAGTVPAAALNTHRMPLARVPEDFASLLDPQQRVVKAIIEC